MGIELRRKADKVAIKYTAEEINELSDKFRIIDADNKGFISAKDLQRVRRLLDSLLPKFRIVRTEIMLGRMAGDLIRICVRLNNALVGLEGWSHKIDKNISPTLTLKVS